MKINYVHVDWDYEKNVNKYTLTTLPPTYNPKTHDLVEKKEAKIVRLKASLELCKNRVEYNQFNIESIGKLLKELDKEMKEIKKELKQLEE